MGRRHTVLSKSHLPRLPLQLCVIFLRSCLVPFYIADRATVCRTQMLTTSRTFLLNATYVRDEWVTDAIADGKLDLSLSELSAFQLEPSPPVCHVGNQCTRSLLTNKAETKKDLEQRVKESVENANCVIDVVSLEGNSGGLVTVYSTPAATDAAATLLHSHLDSRFSLP